MNKKVKISEEKISEIMKNAENFPMAFIEMYKLAIPEFNQVKQIKGFPQMSEKTTLRVLEKFEEKFPDTKTWDIQSLWLNKGFSSNTSLPEWVIDNSNVTLQF